jgi:dienelactone hydrolase
MIFQGGDGSGPGIVPIFETTGPSIPITTMPSNNRRQFLKFSGLAGLGLAGGVLTPSFETDGSGMLRSQTPDGSQSLIGLYGPWAANLHGEKLPAFSFRKPEWSDLRRWRETARQRVLDRMAPPEPVPVPEATRLKQYDFEDLSVEELSWQLPYGRPTRAVVLKPKHARKRLPGILAFHDHGGNKFFGFEKITKTGTGQYPLMREHQEHYYGGRAWANEIARRGYVVMVSDAFTFGSRRVMLSDVPAHLRGGRSDGEAMDQGAIASYNEWAGQHEHVMAKSLFCAGTTWPGVFFAEDRTALDLLCARADVDPGRVGCCGLSGGGLRTVMMGGLDERIRCAVCVGFMSTWRDFLLNTSYTHTWMLYVPLLPAELDFPEILGLRTPLPALVLNDKDDPLYTLPEMQRADNMLTEIYRKAGAPDHYRGSFYPGPHKFDLPMQEEAFSWFDQWL